ncbi:NAD(P)/FAD-dependent oxidoreductase [Micromonospora endolithica]|uniref:FAD-binding oxidoreductase n=1 Tax=Micromonospora endolithica TaxID=230091 RepID=A0A3A9ZCC6_9ACTN|nr:FAD-dependent oxidoreductase [Micromonospora endolithica]RKN46182.1 FAD-binding oxidoreductase [Micromonospora endolithica]TWJ25107.1 FAD dependent oxidoreductase [Micromonospora endolithica]
MPDRTKKILVIGAGLCGLAIAVTVARRGFDVACAGDGRRGASLANFGQLHSGAVLAPVLPDVAQACWHHRNEWPDELLRPAQVGEPWGYALFNTAEAVDRYRTAWQHIGIDVEEINPGHPALAATRPPAAAFRVPDFSVDLDILHARLTALARDSGVSLLPRRQVRLHRDPETGMVTVGDDGGRQDLIVLAAGADIPDLLAQAGIAHTLRQRRIAWGRHAGIRPTALTYWLDGDLLAISPDRTDARIGLPSINGEYGTNEVEYARMRMALVRRGLHSSDAELRLQWGTVCEPSTARADPTSFVADLRDPPAGWSRALNLLVAVPGKWTTAWHCAERVVSSLEEESQLN